MKLTWRWFGPNDPVGLSDIRQAGATGIVNALHELQPGEIWTPNLIAKRQELITQAGLQWSVVESLPVSEEIKRNSNTAHIHLKNYATSLRNLGEQGVDTVCYNFMPILDWTRTALRRVMDDGSTAMFFDLLQFAVFDIHILRRPNAANDFPRDVATEANSRFLDMTKAEIQELSDCVIKGLPGGAPGYSLDSLKAELALYDGIDQAQLRSNLKAFLDYVIPVAEEVGIRLCCHPDDPPFSLLGLPRIMSTGDDLRTLVDAHQSPANGVTFCSGSLGAGGQNNLADILADIVEHVHFVHLRSVKKENTWGMQSSFFEDAHLAGDANLPELIKIIKNEEERRQAIGRSDWQIPVRPDHGQEITTDIGCGGQPGYPLVGRLKGLAEIRGVEAAYDYIGVSAS